MRDKPFRCDHCGVSDVAVRHDSASGINLHDAGMCPVMVAGMPPASSPAHDPESCPCCVGWGRRLASAEYRLAEEQATLAEIEAAAVRCGYDGDAGPDAPVLISDWIIGLAKRAGLPWSFCPLCGIEGPRPGRHLLECPAAGVGP